jgi:hypothetical protein
LYDTYERKSIFGKGESMLKRTTVIMAIIITAGIIFSGLVFGVELQSGPPQESGSSIAPPHHRGSQEPSMPYGMKLLLNTQEINVLAELTGLTQENVRQLLISSGPPAIMEAYGVPPDAFMTAMDKQSARLIKQAAVAGIITNNQEEDIIKRITQRPARQPSMKNGD